MKSLFGRKLEMAARVREFTRAHIKTEPGYGPAVKQLEERLVQAQAIEARLHEGLQALSGVRARRVELRRVILSQLSRDLDAGLSNTVFITIVKGRISDTMVAQFEAASEAVRAARRNYIGASQDLEAICIDLMELVKLIGGITGYRFGNDREVMAEWRAARQIPRQPRMVDSGRIIPPATPPSDIRPAA